MELPPVTGVGEPSNTLREGLDVAHRQDTSAPNPQAVTGALIAAVTERTVVDVEPTDRGSL
jgi:hypothetical protein